MALVARRNTPHISGLCKARWVVERTIAWLYNYHRLCVDYERQTIIQMITILQLALLYIC